MKNFLSSILLYFILCGCHDTADFVPYGCDKFLGHFHFLPTSLDSIPYQGKMAVIFVDSFNNEVKFQILNEFVPDALSGQTHASSTTTEYCYTTDKQTTSILNDSLNINFELQVYTDVNIFDLEDGTYGDFLYLHTNTIWHDTTLNVKYIYGFVKVLAARNLDTIPIRNGYLPNYDIFGKSFNNVEFRLNTESQPIPAIYYNTVQGLVSFQDWKGKKWRFERFE